MGRTAFLFPGQGAQKVGMGRAIHERSPGARSLFDRAAEVLGFDLLEVCQNGPQSRLDATDISQPALYVTALAAIELLRENKPELIQQCDFAAGLSLGEYTALAFADAFSFEDGLRLVRIRGQAMQAAAETSPSGMVSALMLNPEQVIQVREHAAESGVIEIANYLCPGNTVLSGAAAACDRAVELIEGAGGKPIRLAVAGAFHTKLMKPADERLADALAGAEIRSPRIPVLSNVDAMAHDDPAQIREILVRQVLNPVRWEDSIRALMAQGVDRFFEMSPSGVLKGLLKRIDRKASCEAVEAESV